MCGMTTTFTHMAHFDVLAALTTQPFGVVLYLITVSVCVLSFVEIIYPTIVFKRIKPFIYAREGLWYTMLLVGMGSGWIYKIFSMNNWP